MISGHPRLGSYRFFFPMPKNYSCETFTKFDDQNYKVQFEFIVKVVTNEGAFICERVPITVFRCKEKKSKKKKEDEGEDDD